MTVLIVYLGHRSVHPECSSFSFLRTGFCEDHVLSFEFEESSEKKSGAPLSCQASNTIIITRSSSRETPTKDRVSAFTGAHHAAGRKRYSLVRSSRATTTETHATAKMRTTYHLRNILPIDLILRL